MSLCSYSAELSGLVEVSSIIDLGNVKANWHDWGCATVLKLSKTFTKGIVSNLVKVGDPS